MSENRSTLSGKVKRYAKVSSKLTTVSARIAGKKLIGKQDDTKDAELLLNALGGLKGPLMKVAQLLSTVPDLLPKEYLSIDPIQSLDQMASTDEKISDWYLLLHWEFAVLYINKTMISVSIFFI